MPATVVFAATASRDLARIRKWYSQSGSGTRAKGKVHAILKAAESLAEDHPIWPEIVPGVQDRVVEDHVLRYSANYAGSERTGATKIHIMRIYGPGQNIPGR